MYRGVPPQGESSRAQALRAAAGNAMPSATAAMIGTAAANAHVLCRGAGTASLKSRLCASLATSRTAASQSARDRACSKSLRTSSMIPRSWSPTAGCFRVSSIASCSSRRFRQTHRYTAAGIHRQPTNAATNNAARSHDGVSKARSSRNMSR